MNSSSRLWFATALVVAFGLAPALSAQDQRAPEIVHHRVNPNDGGPNAVFGAAPTAGSTSALTAPLKYHGGPVFSTPTAYIIWYGNWAQANNTDTASGQQIVTDFFNAIGGSPYFQINSTYVGSSNLISGNVTYGGATTVAYPYGASLTDANIQSIVADAINSKALPSDTNGIYFVLTSSDVAESSGFCSKYCGWHTHGTINGSDIKYAFIGNAAQCLSACAAQSIGPNGNAGVDGMVSVLAHELEEATTDADASAWYNRRGYENGDLCAWTFGTSYQVANGAYANMKLGTRDFLIQRNVTIRSTGQYCDLVK
ncbi:EXORDIUM family protein [Geothrix oryzisoli]|uniref:EXORDIUM family protein n=1 Tax=Geothrix oryzisoli TaxID=2922721 RepID=UPI001FAE373A|nr:EXORDIUM family protein [Geothrix oryzisoli]